MKPDINMDIRAVSIPLALATELLLHTTHADGCQQKIFTHHNRSMPYNHPVWENRPDCDCHIGQLAAAMKLEAATCLNEPLDKIDNLD